ncbi:MAG TPA: acyltransferase, partial [Ilumatobacteraceae bacterium]|nr:acyltransferase [Ilumatobacteraceae bacterium]
MKPTGDTGPMSRTAPSGVYTPALDGLRALCIAAVVLYHLDPTGWFDGGLHGVSVFFTLSGFLIVRNLVAERETTGGIDALRFWGRRVQRLAPAALATLVVVSVITLLPDR